MDEFGLQHLAIGGGDGGGRVDQHVAARIIGHRVVGGLDLAQHLVAEIGQAQVGLLDPRPVCCVRGGGHAG
jgi:hypothetical protein